MNGLVSLVIRVTVAVEVNERSSVMVETPAVVIVKITIVVVLVKAAIPTLNETITIK